MRHRIKTVSDLTGIPRTTILAWERRHGVLAPERLANGYRLYSDRDVELLRELKAAVSSGITISEALGALGDRDAVAPSRGADASAKVELGAAQVRLFAAFLAFDRVAADDVIRGLAHVSYATLIDDVYMPVLRKIGEEWARGAVTIPQEHFASTFVHQQLISVLLRLGSTTHRGPHVACVTFPGERHEVAILAFSVHLVLRGCRVTYLGADVPQEDLVGFLDAVQPDCLCVAVILAVERRALVRFARTVRRAVRPTMRVVIGGAGIPSPDKPIEGVELVEDWRWFTSP